MAILNYAKVKVAEDASGLGEGLGKSLEELAVARRLRYTAEETGNIPGVAESRQAFKALGIDPSRYRPSSEALLRRVLQDKPMFSVNSAVDVNNYCSIKYGLPFGIYDLASIQGKVVCRLGKDSETYFGLNGRETSMSGKLLTADESGPFGSPVVDSERTKVTSAANDLLHVVYVFPGYDIDLTELLSDVGEMFVKWNGGEIKESYFLK